MSLVFLIPAVILSAVLLIYAGGCLWGFRYACGRMQDPDWDDPQSLASSPFKDHPISIPGASQWLRDHHAEDVETVSHDGVKLTGKWVRAANPIGTVILFHGYHSHYLSDFGGIFQRYHDWGLNLLMVRQRAHGDSEGKYITFGVNERLDALRWVEFHNRVHGMDNVYLSGLSMGSSTVMFAAGEQLPPNVRGITADCGFTSPREILVKVANGMGLPGSLMVPGVCLWARLLAGANLLECNSRQTLARAKVPVLFIHGTADDFVPCWMGQESYDACASEKSIYLVEGAGHGMAYLCDKERIRAALNGFFFGHLSPEYQLEETQ